MIAIPASEVQTVPVEMPASLESKGSFFTDTTTPRGFAKDRARDTFNIHRHCRIFLVPYLGSVTVDY